MKNFLGVFVNIITGLQITNGWLFYSPVSREQTIEDCKRLQTHQSPFYPTYCNKLLRDVLNVTTESPDETILDTTVRPAVTNGWGWTTWGPWLEEACPSVCGRRCRRRIRACHGPYQLACFGQGRAEEFDDCPALNNSPPTNGFQRTTTISDFALYSTRNQSSEQQLQQTDLHQNGQHHDQDPHQHQHHHNQTVPNGAHGNMAASNNHLMHNGLDTMGSMFPAMQDRNFRRRRRRKRLLKT